MAIPPPIKIGGFLATNIMKDTLLTAEELKYLKKRADEIIETLKVHNIKVTDDTIRAYSLGSLDSLSSALKDFEG